MSTLQNTNGKTKQVSPSQVIRITAGTLFIVGSILFTIAAIIE